MKQVRLSLSWLLALCLLFCACSQRQDGTTADGGDTLQLQYAQLLTIVDYPDHSLLTIRNPWHEGVLHSYVLEAADSMDAARREALTRTGATFVRVPLTRSAVFTTVHCALLTELGRRDAIAAVADLQYIKIPWIHDEVRAGRIADCGGGLSPVVEKIMDVKPDAILLSPFENSGGYGKVEDLSIPIIECAEYMEPTPLARAEWMKLYGRLYGCADVADSLFQVVDSCYGQLKRRAAELGQGRRVLMDKLTGSVWYVPGGKSTIGQMIQDAGGRYPWAADEHSGSLSLPFETVLERAADCDVWLYRYSAPGRQTLGELSAEHHGYKLLEPFRRGAVYGCNVERSLFYEEAPFRPDYLLQDFIGIIHADTLAFPLRYYEPIRP